MFGGKFKFDINLIVYMESAFNFYISGSKSILLNYIADNLSNTGY